VTDIVASFGQRIRTILQIGRRRLWSSVLLRNAAALYSVQWLQYLVPLVTLPCLVRALGTDGYGLLSYAGAFGGYAQILCDYGFNLSATRKLAQLRENPTAFSKQACAVLCAKALLGSLGLLMAIGAIVAVPSFGAHGLLFFLCALSALAGSFLPTWLFQGMEKMGGMAGISIGTKFLQLVLWIALVHRPSDLLKVVIVNLGLNLAGAALAWELAHRRFDIRWIAPSLAEIRSVLREGLEIFLSQAGVVLFANTAIMILGSLASAQAVGVYSIAEKIVRVGINLGGPIGTALYPQTSRLLHQSKQLAYNYLNKALLLGGIFFVCVSFGIFITANYSVHIISGHTSPEIVLIVRILSPLPLTIFLDNIFGTQLLLNLGYRKVFMWGTLSAGAISLTVQTFLIPKLGATGAGFALLISEIWCLAYFSIQAWKKTNFPFAPLEP
jgi:PST family polysaccharide transporter